MIGLRILRQNQQTEGRRSMLSGRSQLTLIICVVMVLACGIQSAAQNKPSMKPGAKPSQPAANQSKREVIIDETKGPAAKPSVIRLKGRMDIKRVVDAKYTGKMVKGAPYSATAI